MIVTTMDEDHLPTIGLLALYFRSDRANLDDKLVKIFLLEWEYPTPMT